jgi:hypothetical protein
MSSTAKWREITRYRAWPAVKRAIVRYNERLVRP